MIRPDRHHGLGGPFTSVHEYLRAHIRASFIALNEQQGIYEHEKLFLDRITHFVGNRLQNIPNIVENIPIVAIQADMGPHSIVVSIDTHTLRCR